MKLNLNFLLHVTIFNIVIAKSQNLTNRLTNLIQKDLTR